MSMTERAPTLRCPGKRRSSSSWAGTFAGTPLPPNADYSRQVPRRGDPFIAGSIAQCRGGDTKNPFSAVERESVVLELNVSQNVL